MDKVAHAHRQRVWSLFDRAEDLQDDPDRYGPALLAARAALDEWQACFPEAAQEERREWLLAEAMALECRAGDALLFDADGSLGRDDRQRRHDDYMARAAQKRAEAEGEA